MKKGKASINETNISNRMNKSKDWFFDMINRINKIKENWEQK